MGLPPKQVLEHSKRAKIFINAKGYPRYCITKTLEDGSVVMTEGFSRRGISRGPPGSRKLKDALNGCDDVYFVSFIRECLEWIPEKRLTPENAIKNSWFRRRLPKPPSSFTASSHQDGHQVNTLPMPSKVAIMEESNSNKSCNKLTASVIDNFHNNHINNFHNNQMLTLNNNHASTLSLISQNSGASNNNNLSSSFSAHASASHSTSKLISTKLPVIGGGGQQQQDAVASTLT